MELLAHWGLRTRIRRSLWDADHIVPVTEGGGECDLENIQTLCLRCHREATKRLRERMKGRREESPPHVSARHGAPAFSDD